MKSLRPAAPAVLLAGAFVLVSAATGFAASPAPVPVTIVSRAYTPAQLTVEDGQTVVWKNEGFGPHTVTAAGGGFDSGRLTLGESFQVTFTTPGAFAYACTIHPSMKGVVNVLMPGQHPLPPLGSLHVRLGQAGGGHGQTLVHVQVPAPGATVLLQLHYPSGAPWRTVKRARLSAQGKATLPLSASNRRRLRVVVEGDAGPPLVGKPLTPRG
ncbi:MAG TPA: cupredoxin domain-containing protein [Solirubrobacteraceae bacterium]|nr:cupredoxin domain-containing protein [Solirubrobacteraceae bacterium]